MKRLISFMICAIFIVTILSACGQGNSTSGSTSETTAAMLSETEKQTTTTEKKEPAKIVFLTNETPLLTKDFWKIVSEKFMSQNPNVTIENIAQPSSNVLIVDYLKTLLATGQFPDVTVMPYANEFVSVDALLPFEDSDLDYLANPEIGKINGKSYVAPYKTQIEGIFYNKNIFTDQGFAEPQNYQDFISICDTLNTKGITPIAMGIKDGWPQMILASSLLSLETLGINPNWGADRNKDTVKFDSPEVRKAMEKFQTLVKKYGSKNALSVTYAQMLEIFFKGKAAMIPMGSWLLGEITRVKPDFEVGFFPMPNDHDANTVPVMQQEGLSISAKAKNADVCKAFVRFFFTDKEWYGEFLKTEELFPTTKEPISFDMSPLRKEVGEKIAAMKKVEVFEAMTGDNSLMTGLTGYYTKMTGSIASGADISKELTAFDKEWKRVKDNAADQ